MTVEVAEDVPEYAHEVAAQEDQDDQLEGSESENNQKLIIDLEKIAVVVTILYQDLPFFNLFDDLESLLLVVLENHQLELAGVEQVVRLLNSYHFYEINQMKFHVFIFFLFQCYFGIGFLVVI